MTFHSDEEQDKAAEQLFKGNVTQEGARPVEIEESLDNNEAHGKSRSESEAESSDLSDYKATLHTLFPQFANRIINRVAQAGMIARIAPDVFLDEVYLTVTDVVEMWDVDEDGELDVQEVISLVYFAFSVGIDGKGRVDVIQISSNATETKESSSLGNSLGT
jgi:hypothetical protein